MSFKLCLVEDRLARIRCDAEMVEGAIDLVHDLRQIMPGYYDPILDLRRSAQSLRLAAQKLEEMANQAELI